MDSISRTSSEEELFQAVSNLPEQEAKIYIQQIIFPLMDTRRGRVTSFTEGEISEKLSRPIITEKPGEYFELLEAETSEQHNPIHNVVTTKEALEWADIVYYLLHLEEGPSNKENFFLLLHFDNWSLPYMFCIVKYLTRIQKSGDLPNYKEIEEEIMNRFLEHLRVSGKYPILDMYVEQQ